MIPKVLRVTEDTTAIRLCGACSRTGVCRLGLTEEQLVEPGVSLTRLVCGAEHEGGPGVAHGGWTAAAMDEVLGHLNLLSGRMAVTGELSVQFLRPVPVERPLELRAWCEGAENGRRRHRGELRLASTGALLATAHGVFVERDQSHFERYRRWIAEQDAQAADGQA